MSEALQAALAGEYATIYAYGRAGALLNGDQVSALTDLATHRTDRDRLREWLVADGVQPQPPAPAYTLPEPVTGDVSARNLLAEVELRLIPLYSQLVAEAGDPARTAWAIRQVRECALRAQSWGAAGQAFPWPGGETPPV